MDTKKLDRWASLLLDTGKRNNLVNFKDTKASTVEIILPSPDELFTKVESSASFEVFDPQIADDEATPDARILQQCTMNALVDAMQRLPEADQVAIRMKYFEQRSAREIAAVLGIQEGHVRVRLNRARKRLYDMLREDAE